MLVSSHADADAIAMAHHGSVSKDRRKQIEEQLKRGQLRCVVATSSLELGIDMGSVDLVIQIAPPLSVSSGLQRVGRATTRSGESRMHCSTDYTRANHRHGRKHRMHALRRHRNTDHSMHPLGRACPANRRRRGDG